MMMMMMMMMRRRRRRLGPDKNCVVVPAFSKLFFLT